MSDQQMNPMTDSTSEKSVPEKPESSEEQQPYLYEHAGIKERDGHIPGWLILVVIGLLIWSVYYAIRYWSVS